MNGRIGGQRPRPRVALLGSFEANDLEHFQRMFPTIWQANTMSSLEQLVDVREVDLIIIASEVDEAGNSPYEMHVICFSNKFMRLPGPTSFSSVKKDASATTEEFIFPDVPLPLSRLRESQYGNLTSIRGWTRLSVDIRTGSSFHGTAISANRQNKARTIFENGAIVIEHATNLPLGLYYIREENNLGVSWLPFVDANQSAWVNVILTQWAQSGKDAFPSFGDWTNSSEWMVAEEEQILSQITALEQKKQESVIKIDKQIGEWTTELALARNNANKGRRRLITAQSKELVDEVAKALNDIGFNVTDVDQLVSGKGPKVEDLRLRHVDKEGEEWNAIVEVRGYARSAGNTADLLRLARFADLYKKETGQAPDKLIYIVNGQLELLPSQRQEPLASAPEYLQIFSDTNGILIWSIDLFRALKATSPADYPALLESIKHAEGRWVPFDVPSPN